MISAVPFVGRAKELARLSGALRDAAAGRGRLVMLAGEPGIGKTRTAERLCEDARALGVQALWGRCYEGEGAPPYWPWIQAVRGYLAAHGPKETRRHMGSGAAAIAERIPAVAEHLSDLPPFKPLEDPISARFRFFDALTAFLVSAAASEPLMIVLDDLHWSDGPSLLLLEFLAHHLPQSRLLILGTYRDVEVNRRHPLQRTLGDLARESLFERVVLRGLSGDEVRAYIRAAGGADPPEDMAAAVGEQTEGNPFFLGEVVRLLAAETAETYPGASFRLPEGVKEAVGRRLDRLSEGCNEALAAAAAIGREFGLRTLGRLLDRIDGDALLARLDEALEAHVVEKTGAAGRFQFTHALVQQVLAQELPVSRQARLHARIAEALEEEYGGRAAEHAEELVEHMSKAETVLGTGKLLHFLLLAGEKALTSYAHEEAKEYFSHGMAILEGTAADGRMADFLFGLGRAQSALMEGDRAADSFAAAFDAYEKAGSMEKAVAVATYPFFRERPAHRGEHAAMCERALRMVGKDSVEEAGVLAKLALSILFGTHGPQESQQDRPGELLDKALRIARREKNAGLQMRILTNWVWVDTNMLKHREAREHALEALSLARQDGDLRGECLALFGMKFSLEGSRESLEAQDRCNRELLEACERLRDKSWIHGAKVNCVRSALEMADWTRAREISDSVLAADSSVYVCHAHRSVIEMETGHADAADHALAAAIALTEKDEQGHVNRASMAGYIVRAALLSPRDRWLDVAERYLAEIPATDSLSQIPGYYGVFVSGYLAVIRGDAEAAAKMYGTVLSAPETYLCNEPWIFGLMARTAGRIDDAVRHLRQAVERNGKFGARRSLMWGMFFLAETLLQRSHAGDREEAEDALRRLLIETGATGSALLEGRAKALLAKAREMPEGKAGARTDGLTEREMEILKLVAAGRTNKEIGAALFISTKTVDSHVQHIFTKIGAGNRAEATAYAFRSSLAGD